MSILVVTGGRDYRPDWSDYARIRRAVNALRVTELRHGGCRGVDHHVAQFVANNFPAVKIERYEAAWSEHGRAAGPIRNAAMMVGADALLALPGGAGTANAIKCAKAARLPVYELSKWDIVEPKP